MRREIVDAHFHLWSARNVHPTGVMAAPFLQRDVLWDDFDQAVDGTDVTEAIFVHARDGDDSFEEGRFVQALAAQHPFVSAYVGWAPLESPSLSRHLDKLMQFPLLCGVRRVTQYEEDPAYCARTEFVAGVQLAASRGLVIDLCVQEHQLAGVRALATAAPEAVIVLEHLGKPRLERPPSDEWRNGMSELTGCSNVLCKLSPTIYTGDEPTLDTDLGQRYVEHVIGAFGWNRIMFGSNWPVSIGVVSYRAWIDLLDRVVRGVPRRETARLFADNARDVYALHKRPGERADDLPIATEPSP